MIQKLSIILNKKFTKRFKDLSIEDVKNFLKFTENHHWKNIQRHLNKIDNIFLNDLAELLHEDKPIEERVDNFRKNKKGIGKAVYSAILLVSYPDKYGVWNEISQWSMKFLGIFLEGLPYQDKATKKLSEGEIYKIFNEDLKKIAGELGCSLWTLDAILWRFMLDHENLKPKFLEIGRDYTKEDLNKIFNPELKFDIKGSKWGRNGVIPLFGDKHYGIFASDKAGDILNLLEGTLIWKEQQKMIKNPQNKMLRRIKNNKLIMMLFYKYKDRGNSYTYIGQIRAIPDSETQENIRNHVVKKLQFDILFPNNEFDELEKNITPEIIKNAFNERRENLLENVRTDLKERVVKTRTFQNELRKRSLEYYNGKCLICGIDNEEILRTSHIKPVKDSRDDAGKIRNTLILCALHDAMFDKGLITIDPENNFKILISKRLKDSNSEKIKEEIGYLTNINISIEKIDNQETKAFMVYHKKRVFK